MIKIEEYLDNVKSIKPDYKKNDTSFNPSLQVYTNQLFIPFK